MRISLVQHDIIWNDSGATLTRLRPFIEQAVSGDADFIVLPEMFCTGFSMLQGSDAENAEMAGQEFLSKTASEFGCTLAASFPEVTSEGIFNSLRVYSPEGLLGTYRKIHLFSFGGEQESYRAGTSPLTIQIKDMRVSFFICYDLRFPDAFSALAEKTDLFVVVANWPAKRRAHWDNLLLSRAIENQTYVASVNRIGEGGGLSYNGGSVVISPSGDIIAAAQSAETIISAEINVDQVMQYRSTFPTVRDRRPDIYRSWRDA